MLKSESAKPCISLGLAFQLTLGHTMKGHVSLVFASVDAMAVVSSTRRNPNQSITQSINQSIKGIVLNEDFLSD
jgi:hypothetical protein